MNIAFLIKGLIVLFIIIISKINRELIQGNISAATVVVHYVLVKAPLRVLYAI